MNVYWIHGRKGSEIKFGLWDYVGGFVVISGDEGQARSLIGGRTISNSDPEHYETSCSEECRRLACVRAGDSDLVATGDPDRPCVWRDPRETICELLATGAIGEPRVIMRDLDRG